MWEKIKSAFKKYWKWLVAGLGAILAMLLLGRRNNGLSTYDELKKAQSEREKEAERVVGQVDDVERETEQLIDDFYKRRFERRD